jgi:hypothetical protein
MDRAGRHTRTDRLGRIDYLALGRPFWLARVPPVLELLVGRSGRYFSGVHYHGEAVTFHSKIVLQDEL